MLIDEDTRNGFSAIMLARGVSCLEDIGPEIAAADPGECVPRRSLVLCAGLSEIAVEVAGALGAREVEEDVAHLAASLSLLTKIDDERIDALEFHGGGASCRAALRAKTERFLDVTLSSIVRARPANAEPRAELAASVGRRVRGLAPSAARREAFFELVREGWDTQVDAVVELTQWPEAARPEEVDRVTRRISGDWLAIIAACGALSPEASRFLTPDDVEAIRDAGEFIQRVDSLADLDKDQREGLTSTWAGCWTERNLADGSSIEDRYAAARAQGLERMATPSPTKRAAIAARLCELGGVARWLGWIHLMLLDRYAAHPAHRGPSSRPPSNPPPRVSTIAPGG